MRVVTFKIEENILEKLDRRAIKLRMSRSELIRLAIKTYLNSNHHYNVKSVVLE